MKILISEIKAGVKETKLRRYELTKIPVYIVYHNPELTYFKRFNLVTNQIDILSEKDYWDWIKTL